ncbi:MAG: hypothetical protein HY053_07415 [Proteobacteria bacterium]|nr:hypothetical protein [Pseudomonadota bacterium]
MQTHFTLLFGARAALLLRCFGKEEEKAWMLPVNGSACHDALLHALKERPQAPLRIVIDCKSLDLRREDLPPVNPFQCLKIVGHQGAHHFPKAFLRGAGSWRDGAAFHALHASCQAESALEALMHLANKLPNPMQPLCFFAAEWPDYAGQILVPPPKPWSIALILSEAMGLRQIVLKDGKAAFTRLHDDCFPSLGAAALAEPIAQHLRSTREFLPRLEAGAPKQAPAQLFVPASLESLAGNEALRALECRVVALKAAQAGLVPPDWEADMAWTAQAAEQKMPLVPLVPFWMKQRAGLRLLQKVAFLLMMAFGMAGIFMGSQIMFTPKPVPPPAPLPVQNRVQVTKPPELHLDALIYNSPEDWSVWISGQKYTATAPSLRNVRVTSISAQGVAVRWEQGAEAQDYVLRQENAASDAVH